METPSTPLEFARRTRQLYPEREKRLLEVIGEDVIEEIKRRDSVGPASVLVA